VNNYSSRVRYFPVLIVTAGSYDRFEYIFNADLLFMLCKICLAPGFVYALSGQISKKGEKDHICPWDRTGACLLNIQ
jgi:hypothetical protein